MSEVAKQVGAGDVDVPSKGNLEIGSAIAVPIRLQKSELLPA
jgi:hypothetical protein